jgi:hypothetical protein
MCNNNKRSVNYKSFRITDSTILKILFECLKEIEKEEKTKEDCKDTTKERNATLLEYGFEKPLEKRSNQTLLPKDRRKYQTLITDFFPSEEEKQNDKKGCDK